MEDLQDDWPQVQCPRCQGQCRVNGQICELCDGEGHIDAATDEDENGFGDDGLG